LPASFHGGAGGFSFADGHSEIHKWRSRATLQKVRLSPGFQQIPFSTDGYGRIDAEWITTRMSVRR
jgi:prepilin-type processing-associated H-X9-DG protein